MERAWFCIKTSVGCAIAVESVAKKFRKRKNVAAEIIVVAGVGEVERRQKRFVQQLTESFDCSSAKESIRNSVVHQGKFLRPGINGKVEK